MEGMIKSVVAIEWALFDKVRNCGGRAACQDDAKTFSIMRTSQFRAWSRELLDPSAGQPIGKECFEEN